ncbi:hypothetical protein I302_100751 [Kwoniella bestiolae CBS 10118]|uniref:Mitochondrial distribution and morphology protein 12 n=1 Tax=Kwoniella bestiolae CBS 10118 TaxID=1296100 RepID=A0A1B9G5Y1_9TREE|nr:hypothetical protein I302_04124 [Kwoniella bestiolae CBS 10118]OCF26439.1 hypothetical protein I302_04124 [Kwoniella bestiolae CBS 10118]
MSIDINWSLLNDKGIGSSTPSKSNSDPFTSANPTQDQDGTDIDGENVSEALSTSLINLLNSQLSTSKRPSFIGPITITSFSFGELGPELEIKDIRDVWRVFDQGDEEGDELLEEQEEQERVRMMEDEEKRRMERRGVDSALDGERYEVVNLDSYGYGHDGQYQREATQHPSMGRMDSFGTAIGRGRNHGYSQSISHAPSTRNRPASQYGNVTTPLPRSISNPHTLSMADHQSIANSNSGRSFIPFPFDPNHNHTSNNPVGTGITPSSSLFSPGLGRRPPSIAGSTRNRPASVVDVGIGINHTYNPSIRPPPTHQEIPAPLTRDHSLSLPPSPPALPPRGLPKPSGSTNNVPSAQIHFNMKHKSDLNLVLLTSLQVNYPSNLFMSLPLKMNITGFTLSSDLVVAYSSERNRLHLTLLPPTDTDQTTSTNNMTEYSYNTSRKNSLYNTSVGEKIIPSLSIESEIGHSDAHVLRNVGKVEKFIVDVIRKTVVEELVFPNFHTIAL